MPCVPALQELIELVSPPVAPLGAPFDWRAVESALGSAFPSDYKAFCDVYGHGTFFNGWLWAPHTRTRRSTMTICCRATGWTSSLTSRLNTARIPSPAGVLPF